MTLLRIDSSARIDTSTSRAVADKVEALLTSQTPGPVTRRDLAKTPLPQIDANWVAARLVPAEDQSAEDRDALALSDQLIAELQAADTILISVPIYNFGLPASLKAWIDLIARPKVTFSYGADGPIGHLTGKKVIVVMASGGVKIDSPLDFATPHLRHVLGFVGLDDVRVVTAQDDLSALEMPEVA